jgi:Trk-type K+ transport system membrane component
MRFRPVFYIQGPLLVFIEIFMIFPALFSWYYGGDDLQYILISAGITIAVGVALWQGLHFKGEIRTRENLQL